MTDRVLFLFLHPPSALLPFSQPHLHEGAPQPQPTFRVNSLLAIKQQQKQKQLRIDGTPGADRGDFMTLMFLGFHDKTVADADVRVEVETYLSHASLKKCKDGMGQPPPQERVSVESGG